MKPLTAKLSQEVNTDQPSIQKEYWDTGLGAAGCIFVARDTGKILLAHRNPNKDPERGRVEEAIKPLLPSWCDHYPGENSLFIKNHHNCQRWFL